MSIIIPRSEYGDGNANITLTWHGESEYFYGRELIMYNVHEMMRYMCFIIRSNEHSDGNANVMARGS